MNVLLDTLFALLAVTGVLALGWLLYGRLSAPVGGRPTAPVYLLIPAGGDGAALEQTVNGLLWLRTAGLAEFSIIVADTGLDGTGRAVTELLTHRVPGLVACGPDGLAEYIQRECQQNGCAPRI